MKDMVLSRGRSHVPKDMARGGKGIAQWGEAVLKPVLSSSPGSSGDFALGQSVRGQGTEAQAWVKGRAASLPAKMWDWLSGDVPDAHLGRWPNKPLQGHRAAIVSVPVHKLVAGSPEG